MRSLMIFVLLIVIGTSTFAHHAPCELNTDEESRECVR